MTNHWLRLRVHHRGGHRRCRREQPHCHHHSSVMGEALSSSESVPAAALSLYPLGPSGISLIPCQECGDKVVECKSWTKGGKIFFKCVNYDKFAVKKCPLFRRIDGYNKVVTKKIKEDMEKKLKEEMQTAVAYEGHGETRETKALVEMKPNSRIYEERDDGCEDGQAYRSGAAVGGAMFSN